MYEIKKKEAKNQKKSKKKTKKSKKNLSKLAGFFTTAQPSWVTAFPHYSINNKIGQSQKYQPGATFYTRNNSTPPRGQQQFGSRIQGIIPINNSSAGSNSSNLENTIKGPNHELWQARVQQFESGIQRQCEFCLLLLARNPGTTIKGPATFRI